MLSVIAASMLAATIPTDKLSSVAVAAYWYKKDERGKGDEISEMAKPKRFPAFAIAEDEFLVSDQFVRDRHRDRIEICFKGERVPAKESARIEGQDVVVLKAERPVPGVVPLRFVDGDPVEKLTWSWNNNMLSVRASNVGTNDGESLRPARDQIDPHSPRVLTPTTRAPAGRSPQMLYASWRVPTSSRSLSV